MRIIVTGGGTGGHINPALAVADTVRAREPDSVIIFAGTPHGMENRLVPAAGYELRHVNIRGLRRSLSPANLRTAFLMLISRFEARRLIREVRPDVIFGTGGYACWPLLREGARMGVPTALHEANALAGATTRALERHLDRLFINFDATRTSLRHPDDAIRVGMPVRPAFTAADRDAARRTLGLLTDSSAGRYRLLLLSCGGSLGAPVLNSEILALMRDFTSKRPDILHIHASGTREFNVMNAEFERSGLSRCPNLSLRPFIDDMPSLLAASDLVINRAGAMTLAEMAVLGRPAILIPSPNVTGDHQYKNARSVADGGGALVFRENELVGGKLVTAVGHLIDDRAMLGRMSRAIKTFALPGCAEEIYGTLRDIAKPMKS